MFTVMNCDRKLSDRWQKTCTSNVLDDDVIWSLSKQFCLHQSMHHYLNCALNIDSTIAGVVLRHVSGLLCLLHSEVLTQSCTIYCTFKPLFTYIAMYKQNREQLQTNTGMITCVSSYHIQWYNNFAIKKTQKVWCIFFY